MKLIPVTDTNFYGPEKRMAAERERIRAEEAAKLQAQAAIETAAKTEAPSASPLSRLQKEKRLKPLSSKRKQLM